MEAVESALDDPDLDRESYAVCTVRMLSMVYVVDCVYLFEGAAMR
jgi:hypothetical protein